MLGKAAAPPRLIFGVLLAACLLPHGSSLAVVREEALSNTTMSKSELKAMLRVARAELQEKMKKSGMAVSPWDPNPGSVLTGKVYNCIQTWIVFTEPVWSIIEAIAAAVDSCKGSDRECKEASLSVTEASLGFFGWFLDYPSDCLGKTCAKKEENEERVDPAHFRLTMFSSGVDMVSAIVGATAASFGVHLQCIDEKGDSLGLLKSEKPSPWLHPSMVSFVPAVKDIRENWQAFKSDDPDTWNQRVEKWVAAAERVAGMLQSIMETLMHEHSQGGSPDAKASAADGCVAASAHIAASLLALVTSYFKGMACYRGELELPAALEGWDYGVDIKGQKDRNVKPSTPKRVVEPKTVPISGGFSETDSGSGTGNRNEDLCKLDNKRPLVERCSDYAKQYRKDVLTPTGEKCQKKCCDEASYPMDKSHDSKLQKLLTEEEYCTAYTKPLPATRVKSAPTFGDDSNMALESHRKKTKETNDVLRQKSVTHQIAVSSNPDI